MRILLLVLNYGSYSAMLLSDNSKIELSSVISNTWNCRIFVYLLFKPEHNMKKLLLSITALILLGLPKISAQLINTDFETWTTNALATSTRDPNSGIGTNGWWDFNFAHASLFGYFDGSPVSVFQDSLNPKPEHKRYCAAIVSATMTPESYHTLQANGFWYPKTNGLVITAFINLVGVNVSFKPGLPWSGGRTTSFSFWYRYIPSGGSGNDTCSCAVGMYYHNSVKDTLELIGGAYWSSSATQSSWKQVTVPILYDSANLQPDTIIIQFSASALNAAWNPKSGDTLDIDNSSIVLGVGSIPEHLDNINVYPNPANTAVNLAISGLFPGATVEIYDITGRAIGTYPVRNNFLTINTQLYTTGIYIYKLLNESGDQLNVGKFSVVK